MKIRRFMLIVAIIAMLLLTWRHTTFHKMKGPGKTSGAWVNIGPIQIAAYQESWTGGSRHILHLGLIR